MEVFLDTADLAEIKHWLGHGVLDGVTTNPGIMLKDGGYNIETRAKEIARLLAPRPVSVEVYTSDPEEMMEQAATFTGWASESWSRFPF